MRPKTNFRERSKKRLVPIAFCMFGLTVDNYDAKLGLSLGLTKIYVFTWRRGRGGKTPPNVIRSSSFLLSLCNTSGTQLSTFNTPTHLVLSLLIALDVFSLSDVCAL